MKSEGENTNNTSIVEKLLSNGRSQVSSSNKRWGITITIALLAVTLDPVEESAYEIFGTKLNFIGFLLVAAFAASVTNIAFLSSFAAAAKTGRFVNKLIPTVELQHLNVTATDVLLPDNETPSSAVAEDLLRTGTSDDYVRIFPIFEPQLTPFWKRRKLGKEYRPTFWDRAFFCC
ncbi:MAG: hypothetical protein KJN60_13115 [Boseongicola sp.]|nr:hypothetical protein [Boseongicola sp.]